MIRPRPAVFSCALLAIVLIATPARARITFDFDYAYDSANFFTPAARSVLERAATYYSDRLLDNLTPIAPAGSDTWSQRFINPATGDSNNLVTVANPTVPANTLKIYVAGRNLGSAIGLGGPGGISASGTQGWLNTVQFRGQSGAESAPPTDFANWGGTIAFDNTVQWNFNQNAPAPGKNDLLTVATHELAHVLGFGLAASFKTYMTPIPTPSNTQYVGPFTGPRAVALYGGNVPLETPSGNANAAHFQPGVTSHVGTITGPTQETIMDPDITLGTRKIPTVLDWAVLDDVGWDLARPGDTNADGAVDFADLVAIAQHYNTATGQSRWLDGDFNYDGNVTFADMVLLAQNYNTTGPLAASELPASAAPAFSDDWTLAQAMTVPEPATLTLLALACLPLLAARKKSTRRP